MDEGLSRSVQTMFKRLHDDGLIYRAERIINWCPRDLTALSDIEVDHSEDDGELVSIRYGDGADSIVVATTRAETMLGDTAVAVHPDDERYQHLIGKTVPLPLTDRHIPIVADAHVDPSFGTGAVKVTPAHDPNDFEIGQRHNLPSPDHHGRARRDHRAWSIRGARSIRGAAGRGAGAARRGPNRRRDAAVCAFGGALFALRFGDRTAAVDAVVRARSRRSRRPQAMRCAMAGCALCRRRSSSGTSTGSTTCTTGASAASSGGAIAFRSGTHRTGSSRSASVRTSRRPRAGRRIPTCSTPGSRPGSGRFRRWAGPTRPTISTSSIRLQRARHRLRHRLLLGRPDDDVQPLRDGRAAPVQRGAAARPGARQVRQEDVEVEGQRGRSARVDRRVRRRCRAVVAGAGRQPGR